jgi:transaldolase
VIAPLQSLIASGTKVWLDSIAPEEVARNRAWGITGATSNPVIVADLIEACHCDDHIARLLEEELRTGRYPKKSWPSFTTR